MQTPPEFRPKTYVPVRNKILTTIGTIILSAIVGFGAGYAGSHLSNNTDITIKQETQKPVFRGLHHECLEAILRKS